MFSHFQTAPHLSWRAKVDAHPTFWPNLLFDQMLIFVKPSPAVLRHVCEATSQHHDVLMCMCVREVTSEYASEVTGRRPPHRGDIPLKAGIDYLRLGDSIVLARLCVFCLIIEVPSTGWLWGSTDGCAKYYCSCLAFCVFGAGYVVLLAVFDNDTPFALGIAHYYLVKCQCSKLRVNSVSVFFRCACD